MNLNLFEFRLSDEIDELKNLPVRDTDEDLFELRQKCDRLHIDLKTARTERDVLQQDIDHKQNLLQKHEFDMQKQVETVAYLNDEVRFYYFKTLHKVSKTFPKYRISFLLIIRNIFLHRVNRIESQ